MSPTRFQGELFRFFSWALSSSCFPSAASFAAIVSFLAARAVRKASASLRRVSLSSFRKASVCDAVASLSRKAPFSRSRASASRRVAERSSTAAAQALMICDALGSVARVAEAGELAAELGGCACDALDAASTASVAASSIGIFFE